MSSYSPLLASSAGYGLYGGVSDVEAQHVSSISHVDIMMYNISKGRAKIIEDDPFPIAYSSLEGSAESDAASTTTMGGAGDDGTYYHHVEIDAEKEPEKTWWWGQNDEDASLGVLETTALAANDTLSSLLYSLGAVSLAAGKYSPLCFLMAGLVVYFFRTVYAEACTAFPLNGGAYSVLLNTTSKAAASFTACLLLLSYTSTAVVSATECARYLSHVLSSQEVLITSVLLLFGAGVVHLTGIRIATRFAVVIFVFHLVSVVVLCVWGVIFAIRNPQTARENFNTTPIPPTDDIDGVDESFGLMWSLVWGFGEAMLGVTGIETLGNFIQQQRKGVFVPSVWWLCVLVGTINTAISIVCLLVVPVEITSDSTRDAIASLAEHLGGVAASRWISTDAALVLAGATIATFVGVSGLVRALSADRLLPQFLIEQSNPKAAPHRIALAFCIMCILTVAFFGKDVRRLAKVYTLAFLCIVMVYAVGASMLKYKRPFVAKQVSSSWAAIFLTLIACSLGVMVNIVSDATNLTLFVAYCCFVGTIIYAMFERARLVKFLAYLGRRLPTALPGMDAIARAIPERQWRELKATRAAFFAKDANMDVLNRAITYSHTSEVCSWLIIVHCTEDDNSGDTIDLFELIKTAARLYPKVRLDYVVVKAPFARETVQAVSTHIGVPPNRMFISAPTRMWQHDVADYGGLRIITH